MVKLGTSSRTDKMAKHEEPEGLEVFRRATEDLRLAKRRRALARFSTNIFSGAGNELHLIGHIIGTDRVSGASPWGHGTDETVAISVLLRIASQLVSSSADLFKDGRAYAAAALLRQLVEIEYLAWAFETRHRDAERWLRSDQKEREAFFRPAKLRAAAQGRFRGLDYSFHCELGGHPVPRATLLLRTEDRGVAQLLLFDLLGHTGRIWDHIVGWARNSAHGGPILERAQAMSRRFSAWKSFDPLTRLPPPPPPPDGM
jgi:hypothetical protein